MLEILITGSSRPQLWPYFWESFKKMCIIRQPHKITVHEDYVFGDRSEQVMKYLRHLKEKGEIDVINADNPARGLGWTLDHYIKNRLESEYVFYLQEDWEFERPIDIDQITYVMDQHPQKINLIFFNKIKNSGVINKCEQREYTYSGMKVCLYHGWAFLPGIWRRPFVRKNWVKSLHKPEGAFQQALGSHETRVDVKYCENRIGAYIYGRQGEHRYVRHLGNDWRMAEWRLEGRRNNIRPGGNHGEHMDKPYMAPWVPYPKRPVQARDGYDPTLIDRVIKGEKIENLLK